MATKLKQFNLNNPVDLNMLITELAVCDSSGILVATLRLIVTSHMMTRHHEGKKPYGADDFVPIPSEFTKFLKEWREGLVKAMANCDNLIQLVEEGQI